MTVKWKKSSGRFRPDVVLNRINKIRTVGTNGGASFQGLELEELMPALESMLQFPPISREIGKSDLVWHALTKVPGTLTSTSVLNEINDELSRRLATSEREYVLLTSISVTPFDIPKVIRIGGATLRAYQLDFPARFKSRSALIASQRLTYDATPEKYCRVALAIKSKSPRAAADKALDALDLQRALWCLMLNPAMQYSFGQTSTRPINVIRLGGQHTLHEKTGRLALETVWYEPSFVRADVFSIKDRHAVNKRSSWARRQIQRSKYGGALSASLLRYVRALDDRDPNSAFIKLWGALEGIASPDVALYERVVRRCAFIFKDTDYHTQVLEHLRERRNEHVHIGVESDRARTHCLQLQRYFAHTMWFHLFHADFFESLEEANQFLDSPTTPAQRARNLLLAKRVIRFTR